MTGTEADLKWTNNPRLTSDGHILGRQYVTFETRQALPEARVVLRLRTRQTDEPEPELELQIGPEPEPQPCFRKAVRFEAMVDEE